MPSVTLNQLGNNFGSAITDGSYQNAIQFSEGLTKTAGAHTFKFGGFFGYSQWNRRGGPSSNGSFTFNGGETGNDFADFLLGAPDQFVQGSAQAIDARSKSGAVYGQDSFRIKPNFTVNYGLRWEFSQPWYDTQNRLQAFVPGQQSVIYPNAPTGWVFPGDKGIPGTLANTRWNDFAPRFGFAFSPNRSNGVAGKVLGGPGKTSIRAAAGIFYTTFDTSGQTYETGDAPFGFYYVSPVPVYLDTPFQSRVSAVNPGQRFPYVTPTGGSTNFDPFLPISYSPAYDTGNKQPYAIDMNFTVQRQIGATTILTVGYVGTLGHHLFSQIPNNPGNPKACLAIDAQFAAAGQPAAGCGPYGEDSIYTINGRTYYGTRPYSVTSGRGLSSGLLDFGNNSYESTVGNSSYHSFQATVNKSLGPFRFLGAYTFSKALDNASGFFELINPYNNALSKSLSAFDITHNFVISYSYDLPFTKWISARSGFVFRLLEGWQISGITRFSTGIPITLSFSGDNSLCGCSGLGTSAVDLPNYNGGPIRIYNPRTSANFDYFSTNVFSEQALGQIGTANRRFLHGPGLDNTDLSLVKTIRIAERLSIDIRAEMFNIFNHAQFNNPVGDYASPNFGQVITARDPRIGQMALKLHF